MKSQYSDQKISLNSSDRFVVAANWKMHKNPNEVKTYVDELHSLLPVDDTRTCVFFSPALLAHSLGESFPKRSDWYWGGQNCYHELSGAFTGENSPAIFKDFGATWMLVGHSERRTLFRESDELLAKKVQSLQKLSFTVMLCVGESLVERDSGDTNKILLSQLQNGLSLAQKDKKIYIAYEPVWAIGTGRVATEEQIYEAHEFIEKSATGSGFDVQVLYGGSVNAENSVQLARIPNVRGFLVGGASLKSSSFAQIALSKKSNGQN